MSKGGRSLPASPIHVALYLTDLLESGRSESVVSSALYGIKWAYRICDLQDPTNNAFVSNLVEAANFFVKRLRSSQLLQTCLKCCVQSTLVPQTYL